MGIFGMIGYFLKEAWQGFAEIIVGPLTPARPDPTAKAGLAATAEMAKKIPAPAATNETRLHATSDDSPISAPIAEDPAPAPSANPPSKAATKAATRSGANEADSEAPGSPVAQRYRTLKAEGLLPKHASEFSRSAKKYSLFRTLSTTRPHDGAATYWELVKDFEQNASAHVDKLKESGASKQKIAYFKTQADRARDLLIQKFVRGKEALAEADADFVHEIAKTIGFEDF